MEILLHVKYIVYLYFIKPLDILMVLEELENATHFDQSNK